MYFAEKLLFSATSTFESFTCPVWEELSLSHTPCQVVASQLLWGLQAPGSPVQPRGRFGVALALP